MSTPPKATPTTPQWAIEAAKDISAYFIKPAWCVKADTPFVAAIIAKHAPPPAAQPSDAAGLREVILGELEKIGPLCGYPLLKRNVATRILTALAPYLNGEPGDSELLEFAEKHASEIHSKIGSPQGSVVAVGIASDRRFYRGNALRAVLRAAMRGERGAE